jgi:hypothetical protein
MAIDRGISVVQIREIKKENRSCLSERCHPGNTGETEIDWV